MEKQGSRSQAVGGEVGRNRKNEVKNSKVSSESGLLVLTGGRGKENLLAERGNTFLSKAEIEGRGDCRDNLIDNSAQKQEEVLVLSHTVGRGHADPINLLTLLAAPSVTL